MEFLGDLLGGVASVASGGIFGLIGSTVGAIAKYFQKRQEFDQERQRREWDREDFRMQMQFSAQETEQELAIASAQGSWSGLSESIRADAAVATKGGTVTAAIRSMFRPFLTTLLVCVSAWIVWFMWQGVVDGRENGLQLFFTPEEMADIIRYAIYSLLFSTSTAVVWWFGDRAMTPPGMRGR